MVLQGYLLKSGVLRVALVALVWPGWQAATEITTTPLVRGVPAVAEFRKTLLDFSPGAPDRTVRLRQDGAGRSFSLEACEGIGNKLITQLDNLPQFQLQGLAFGGKPLYFAERRMFLVSIDPAVMVVIPQPFSLKHPQRTVQNYNLNTEVNSEYWKFSGRGMSAQPQGFSVHMANWLNYLELSQHVPRTDGVQILSMSWRGTISLENAVKDSRFPLVVVDSSRFPGYLEFRSK